MQQRKRYLYQVKIKIKRGEKIKERKCEIDLLLAEELPAVPAMVASLGKREADCAAGAAVHNLVLHPVVCC